MPQNMPARPIIITLLLSPFVLQPIISYREHMSLKDLFNAHRNFSTVQRAHGQYGIIRLVVRSLEN